MTNSLYVRGLRLNRELPEESYVSHLPVVRFLQKEKELMFHSPVTFLVGENGMGKSTLLEAAAVALGFNPEGGSKNFCFSTRDTHSELGEYITVIRGMTAPKDGFFFRAESFYNAASYIDEVGENHNYGGSLHEMSHGESFLSLVENRFRGKGIYLLDEPEAALSPMRVMRLMVLIAELQKGGSQFLISTHSPMLMALPGAEVLELREDGIRSVPYRETEHYQTAKRFLEDPERMMGYLL